jgi:hypothetical protein
MDARQREWVSQSEGEKDPNIKIQDPDKHQGPRFKLQASPSVGV